MKHSASPLERLVEAYETLRPETVENLLDCYAETAHFRDPFNDVRGREAIGSIFRHMFASLPSPSFTVTGRYGEGEEVVLRWEFRFVAGGGERLIEGLSTLRFDADGRVAEHQDYWDPAANLYEAVPLLGWLLARIRRRLAAPGDRGSAG